MTPRECGHTRPFLRGREDRGRIKSAYPFGTFTITFPGTSPIAPGSINVVFRVTKSKPTAPPVSYLGSGRLGSMRFTSICMDLSYGSVIRKKGSNALFLLYRPAHVAYVRASIKATPEERGEAHRAG